MSRLLRTRTVVDVAAGFRFHEPALGPTYAVHGRDATVRVAGGIADSAAVSATLRRTAPACKRGGDARAVVSGSLPA
jgi:hypothetical protein